MTSNQKKALKAEHTNRLKNAFVKALQQEQVSSLCTCIMLADSYSHLLTFVYVTRLCGYHNFTV